MEGKKTAHFIGMGGIGMSGLARMYLAMGYAVQGSDIVYGQNLSQLESMGARVFTGHDRDYVRGADFVVYSSSIKETHPERLAALEMGIPLLHRAEALAQMCRGRYTIAIAGTHGKTTTTALVGMILKEAGRDPSIVVGGMVKSFGGNAVYGQGPEIVIEADESDSSFLNFNPHLAVVTNIEEDHMDHFESIQQIRATFSKFISGLAGNGHWIACAEDENILRILENNTRSYSLYGFGSSKEQLSAVHIEECPANQRGICFDVLRGGSILGSIHLKIIGRHNALNALAAIGVGLRLNIPFEVIKKALSLYEGAGRRFDVRYEDDDYLVVDDYAHHPTEIEKTLAAAKGLRKKRILAVFQPHRYSRTRSLIRQFGTCFKDADKLIITDIYAAGEEAIPEVSGEGLCQIVKAAGHQDATFIQARDLTEYLYTQISSGDLLLMMGAGDIYEVARHIARDLKNKKELKAPVSSSVDGLFAALRGSVLVREPLSCHTYFRIGGPSLFWIEPEEINDLQSALYICRRNGLKTFYIGAGSNLLVKDEGVDRVFIHLGSSYFCELWIDKDKVVARAGTSNAKFVEYATANDFGGHEFLSGIPGTIGGSIAMNAGSHNECVANMIESITVLNAAGKKMVLKKQDISFQYRSANLKDLLIIEASFILPKISKEKIQQKLDEYRAYRLATQDLMYASAGCVFKNPPNLSKSSGKLIEEAGLKGKRVGQAQVSERHANFIINLGGATYNDVMALIKEIRKAVKRTAGIDLELEIKVVGSEVSELVIGQGPRQSQDGHIAEEAWA